MSDRVQKYGEKILQSTRNLISYRYHAITKAINKEFWELSSETMHSIYVGSYGRNTAINTSDIDILVEIPSNFFDRFNSLSGNSQSRMLQVVKNVIINSYPRSNIHADGQVIKIDFSDGMNFEIVPAFKNINGSYQNYVFYSKFGINLSGSKDNTLDNSPSYLGRFVSHVDIDIPNSSPSRITVSTPSDKHVYVYYKSYPAGSPNIPNAAKNTDQVNPSEFMLTQKEMLDILRRMLENNQTNHAELMNQLAKMGVMNQSAEQSTFSPDTALSAPYTPEGSSTPQQTRFKMHQDGTVSVDYVPRPDLKPNSPEAPNKPDKTTPSRKESTETPNAPNSPNSPNTPNESNSQNEQNQNDKEKDFCQQNPNSAQCILGGKSEDIKLPEQTIDLNFKPLDVFQSDGKCPAPRSVDFGALGQVEFSYDPLCDLARKLRPIFIAICVLTCAYFVYESVKEL